MVASLFTITALALLAAEIGSTLLSVRQSRFTLEQTKSSQKQAALRRETAIKRQRTGLPRRRPPTISKRLRKDSKLGDGAGSARLGTKQH